MSVYNLPDEYLVPKLQYPGPQRRTSVLEGDPAHFLVYENYLVKKEAYSKLARNTPNDTYGTAFLVDEDIDREEGDGVWFNRVYANLPVTIEDWTNGSMVFPGIADGRPPMPARTVRCKVVRRFYKVGTETYPTVDSIPVTKQTTLQASGMEIGFLLSGNTITIDAFTVTTGGDAPGVTATPQQVGGFLFDDGMGINAASSGAATTYTAMILADLTAGSYSIVVEASEPGRYMGNIWFTDTIYTKAL